MLNEKDELFTICSELEQVLWQVESLSLLLVSSQEYGFIASLTRPLEKDFRKQYQRLFALVQGGAK